MNRDRWRIQLALVLTIALACRVAWWVAHVSIIENEGTEYARIAENLVAGRGYIDLLGGRNFVLVYDPSHRLRVVQLLGAPPASAEVAASAAPAESPAVRAERSLEGALDLLDRYPAASLQGKLADTLGEDSMPLRRLLQVGLQHPYRTTRERVMRRFLAEVESDADLDAAFLGSLAGVDDASLGDLVRRMAGERAEEMLFYVATQASGELRARAAAVLDKLRTGADIVGSAAAKQLG